MPLLEPDILSTCTQIVVNNDHYNHNNYVSTALRNLDNDIDNYFNKGVFNDKIECDVFRRTFDNILDTYDITFSLSSDDRLFIINNKLKVIEYHQNYEELKSYFMIITCLCIFCILCITTLFLTLVLIYSLN